MRRLFRSRAKPSVGTAPIPRPSYIMKAGPSRDYIEMLCGRITCDEYVRRLKADVDARLGEAMRPNRQPAGVVLPSPYPTDYDALIDERDELHELVTEAYVVDHVSNRWRVRAERLGAWPGATTANEIRGASTRPDESPEPSSKGVATGSSGSVGAE